MKIKIIFKNPSGRLNNLKNPLKKEILSTIKKVNKIIKLDSILITIEDAKYPDILKDLNGIGASCPSKNKIEISIDTNHQSLNKLLADVIKKPLLHELHHIARRQSGIKIDKDSLLECLVSEGLADYFVYKITKTKSKWIIPLDKSNKERLTKMMIIKLNKKNTNKNYNDWFIYGSKKEKIPRGTGYTIGFTVIKNIFKKNKDKNLVLLTSLPAKEIISSDEVLKYT